MTMFTRLIVVILILMAPIPVLAHNASANKAWKELCRYVADLSRRQSRSGQPTAMHRCYPETSNCVTSIASRELIVLEVENADGVLTRRIVCRPNIDEDVVRCSDWDTHESFTQMKDKDGVWRDAR
jgi:hypothetical protein